MSGLEVTTGGGWQRGRCPLRFRETGCTGSFVDKEELKTRCKRFALLVMRLSDDLPRTTKGRVLAHQLLRSATSVAAGYRAACRARSQADWVDKIGRVLEEADESLLWLELIEEGAVLAREHVADLRCEAAQLTALFAAIHRTSKSQILNPKS
jgi:four helix bundle protein